MNRILLYGLLPSKSAEKKAQGNKTYRRWGEMKKAIVCIMLTLLLGSMFNIVLNSRWVLPEAIAKENFKNFASGLDPKISGLVADRQTGGALEGISVFLKGKTLDGTSVSLTTTTNNFGQYSFQVAAGNYNVTAVSDKFAFNNTVRIPISSDDVTVNFAGVPLKFLSKQFSHNIWPLTQVSFDGIQIVPLIGLDWPSLSEAFKSLEGKPDYFEWTTVSGYRGEVTFDSKAFSIDFVFQFKNWNFPVGYIRVRIAVSIGVGVGELTITDHLIYSDEWDIPLQPPYNTLNILKAYALLRGWWAIKDLINSIKQGLNQIFPSLYGSSRSSSWSRNFGHRYNENTSIDLCCAGISLCIHY